MLDDFSVKYEGKQSANYLVDTLTDHYEISIDWAGTLLCGIFLNWDYINRWVDLAMPDYIAKMLHRFQHAITLKPQHAWHQHEPLKYGTMFQTALVDISTPLSPAKIKQGQKIVDTLLYYSPTMAAALGSIVA